MRYMHNALGQRVFKSQVMASQTAPQGSTLAVAFIEWLKQQFSWLLTASTSSSNAMLGQAYVYGDGEIPNWPLLGGYTLRSGIDALRRSLISNLPVDPRLPRSSPREVPRDSWYLELGEYAMASRRRLEHLTVQRCD